LGLDSSILFAEHPKELLKAMYHDILPPSPQFLVVVSRSEPTRVITENLETDAALKKFDEFFDDACRAVRELDVVVEIRKTLGELNYTGQEVQARTLRQIREPWSM
jgi:hypothetical protein